MSNRTSIVHRLILLGLTVSTVAVTADHAAAKTPGHTYCFISTCHRVLTLAETKAAIGKPRVMHASHYDDPSVDRFNPSLITSSGELFRPGAANNAASPIYPDGTLVAVFAPSTKRGAIVRINNAGPYWGNRLIDLSRGLANKLGVGGVSRVVVEVLAAPRPEEAKYVRGRRYPAVAGFIGKVADIEAVRENWQIQQGIKEPPSKTAPVLVAAQPPQPVSPDTTLTVAAMSTDDMQDAKTMAPLAFPTSASPTSASPTSIVASAPRGARAAPPSKTPPLLLAQRSTAPKKPIVHFR